MDSSISKEIITHNYDSNSSSKIKGRSSKSYNLATPSKSADNGENSH